MVYPVDTSIPLLITFSFYRKYCSRWYSKFYINILEVDVQTLHLEENKPLGKEFEIIYKQ